MFNSEALVGLPGFEVTEIGYEGRGRLSVRYVAGGFEPEYWWRIGGSNP